MCILKRIYIKTELSPYSFCGMAGGNFKKICSLMIGNKNGMAFHSKIKIFNFEKDTFFKEIVSPESLIIAWKQLKKNPGFMKIKTISESVNDLDLRWFEKTSLKLTNGKFQYFICRKIKVLKFNSKEL